MLVVSSSATASSTARATYYPDDLPAPPRIHVEGAARRTLALLDAPSGIVVLTDDDQ